MATTHAPEGPHPDAGGQQHKGLRRGAIGVVATTVIGVSSTAPAYSLAATVGLIAAVAGPKSPAIMLIAFLPMLFTASAYYYLNRADPDCGATFSWVRRAMGPSAGWLGGWGVVIADIVVMPNLAYVGAQYTFLLVGADNAADSIWWNLVLGIVYILAMTWVTWRGIELSARTQFALLGAEILVLIGFAIYALVRVLVVHPAGSITPSLSWLSPSGMSSKDLSAGVLLAIFIYWGWDTTANLNEENKDRARAPGVAAVASTLILLATYVVVSFATTAVKGPGFLSQNTDDALTVLVGSPWNRLMMLAILASAVACAQTTILPTARTTLSMATNGAAPRALARIHPRYLTPTVSTWAIGLVSALWYLGLVLLDHNGNLLWDSISSLGFAIAFYYALTALAAPIYFRHLLFRSVRTFLLVGVAPVLGAAGLVWAFVQSIATYRDPSQSSGSPWFAFGSFGGVPPVLAMGIGMLVLGLPLMLGWRLVNPSYFRQSRETADTLEPDAGS